MKLKRKYWFKKIDTSWLFWMVKYQSFFFFFCLLLLLFFIVADKWIVFTWNNDTIHLTEFIRSIRPNPLDLIFKATPRFDNFLQIYNFTIFFFSFKFPVFQELDIFKNWSKLNFLKMENKCFIWSCQQHFFFFFHLLLFIFLNWSCINHDS